jgi:3-oxoacyl-[acyl-carrier protein] reductase
MPAGADAAEALQGRVAVVTGGARGIGAAICRALAARGAFVYVNSRARSSRAVELVDAIRARGDGAELLLGDITDADAVDRMAVAIRHEQLDLLVHNAGISRDGVLPMVARADWAAVLDTNVFAAVRLTELLEPRLARSPLAVVLGIGSISALRPRKGQAPYAVSKAMLVEWIRMRGRRAGSEGIRYLGLCPGPVATNLIAGTAWARDPQARARIPLRRFAEPDEIAAYVVHLVAHARAYANGTSLVLDGGVLLTSGALG